MTRRNRSTPVQQIVRWWLTVIIPTATFFLLISTPSPVTLGNFESATAEQVLLALGRLAGLIFTSWLVTSQLLYTVAIVTRTDWLRQLLRPLTLPVVRRLAAGFAATSISFSTLTALAQAPPSTPTSIEEPVLSDDAISTPILQPLIEVEDQPPDKLQALTGSYSAPLTWLVRPGDHLWKIAGEHLTIVLGRQPSQREHARYWVDVVDAARPVIRSHNPDLIYPGEQVPLPPTLNPGVTP